MLCEVPLTDEQRDYATEHHALVYKFLKDNHLSMDEFYDVIIFGYLRAVKRYLTESALRQYKFTTIAWSCMRVDLYNYYKSNRCQKRTAEVLSIHIGIGADSYSLEETVAASDDLMQQLETRLLLHDLAGKFSGQQMEMVRLKTCGYNLREIARQQKTPMRQVKETLEEVRTALIEMCYQP